MQIIYTHLWWWLVIALVSLAIAVLIEENERMKRTNEHGLITELWKDKYHNHKLYVARTLTTISVVSLIVFAVSAFSHFIGNNLYP